MKKITMVLLALLLVLSIGQAAFAKGSIGLTMGYTSFIFETDSRDGFETWKNGLKVNLNGNYYFTDKISLAAGLAIDLVFNFAGNKQYEFTQLGFSIFGRYDVFTWDFASIGLQLGISDSLKIKRSNFLYLSLGTFADVDVTSKINIYTDIKFPLATFSEEHSNTGFFKTVLYDVTLGSTYKMNSKLDLGLEGNISNVNACSNDDMFEGGYYKDFSWSIGVKLGYNF